MIYFKSTYSYILDIITFSNYMVLEMQGKV